MTREGVTIAEFMAARFVEDTVEADRAYSETLPLHVYDCEWETFGCNCVGPARVRVELDAKRRIVEAHRPLTSYPVGVLDEDGALTGIPEGSFDAIVHTQHGCPTCAPIYSRDPCDTLRALAAPYAGHPDFDEAWRL